MKILSFNVRGIGGMIKRRKVWELIRSEDADMVLLQETKLEACNRFTLASLWGDGGIEWQQAPAVNAAGGLLCLWKSCVFKLDESFIGDGFVGLRRKWKQTDCLIVNIYSPCLIGGKRRLWRDLLLLKQNFGDYLWCIAGDFNAVRTLEERKGTQRDSRTGASEIQEFNDFIEAM